jgi:formate dehydrogenase beta subunit
MAHPTVCKVEGDFVKVEAQIPKKLVGNFAEVEPVYSLKQAVAEAKRCTTANPCVYCDVCQLLCPDLAITRDEKTSKIVIDLEFCKGCGLCAHYCPHGAIKMELEGSSL